MAAVIYHIFVSSAMMSLGLYHLVSTIKTYLKTTREYSAKPLYPLNYNKLTKHLHLYLIIFCLVIAFCHQTVISAYSDPLLKGGTAVHRLNSLQSAGVIFSFLVLSVALLLSEATSALPLPSDLFFGIASALFFLQYSASSEFASVQISDLQAKCDSVFSHISALTSILCLVLACNPKLFVADVALGGSLFAQGLWILQTGLTLHVDAFIPAGCNKMLDVVSGVEGSTKCDLDESKFRAVAILDLVFVLHVLFVLLLILIIYAVLARTITVSSIRRFGTYEVLPTVAVADSNHIQMKSLTGTQA
jgi:hypothetical protein